MRVLVAGGTGFIGRAVVRTLLDRGADVVTLSRSGDVAADNASALAGDVTVPGLGLTHAATRDLLASVTHAVGCFGSVDWRSGPDAAGAVHGHGARNLLDLLAGGDRLESYVHMSSLLVLGRSRATVGNRHLDTDQSFRNWYEYGKFLGERVVRDERRLPWQVLRPGPVLGTGPDGPPAGGDGILSVLPYLLRGLPMPLVRGGDFPCFPCDATCLAGVVAWMLEHPEPRRVWSWWDHRDPSLAATLEALCDAWGVVPRIVDLPLPRRLARLAGPRLGLPAELHDYTSPWFDLEAGLLDRLPDALPRCPESYLHETGVALRRTGIGGVR